MPSEAQLAQLAVANVSGKIGFVALKMKSILMLNLFLISTLVVASYIFWPKKIETKIEQTLTKKVEAPKKILVIVNYIFNPIDFNKYKSFDFRSDKKVKKFVMDYTVPDKWNLKLKPNNHYKAVSVMSDDPMTGGLVINNQYRENNLFQGSIKLTDDKNGFQFVLGCEDNLKNTENFINIGSIQLEKAGEVDFKLYVWKNNNIWNSACFIYVKDDPSKNKFIFNPLEFVEKEYLLGFWSGGYAEANNFACCHLDISWDLRKETAFKDVLTQLPESLIPASAK